MSVTDGTMTQFHNPHSGYHWREMLVRLPQPDGSEQEARARLVYSPGVYLVGYQHLDREAVDEFLHDHQITGYHPGPADPDGRRGSDDELMIELGGRLCYMSYDKPRPGGLAAFLLNLKSEGHGSVFEHPHYNFIFTGISRNLTLEANRHRTFSISQLSGRFVDSSQVGFVIDPDMPEPELYRWSVQAVGAMREYEARFQQNMTRLLVARTQKEGTPLSKPDERKIIKRARERARDILPGALETRVMYTVNTRALRFIMEKRCAADAAFEIRRVFNRVFHIVKAHDPNLFSDYTETQLDDGTFYITTPHQKI